MKGSTFMDSASSIRPSEVVRAEMEAASKALDGLQQEYRRALRTEISMTKVHDVEAKPAVATTGSSTAVTPLNNDNDKTGVLRRMRDYVLEENDVRDASDYQTELSEMFSFDYHAVDGELDRALLPALDKVVELVESGTATPYSIGVEPLRTFMQGHPRGFARYFVAAEPAWPRLSAVVKAEIDSQTPHVLDWLRFELECALAEEARDAKSRE